MSRKQFDRMELLTDETEVDRTFLYSKLHAIVHVPFSLPLSLSLSLFLFAHPLSSLSLPTLRRPSAPITESDRVQVASTYFCKNLGMPEARRIRRKARAECTPRYFKRRLSAISRDLIQDRVSGPRHFICR